MCDWYKKGGKVMKLKELLYVTTNDIVLDIYSNDGKTYIRHVQDEPHYKLLLMYGELTVVDINAVTNGFKRNKYEPDTLFVVVIEGDDNEI